MTRSLPSISALVRAGAVERAWELFESGGFAARSADPAALALKGRLLKARARGAAPTVQSCLFSEAAAAYRTANSLAPAPYLAINAATLELLAGNPDAAREAARSVLAMLDGDPAPLDTPYFLAATRAEAMLLLGDQAAARQALELAIAENPAGWDDRAATITQLREIVAAQGDDSGWLLPYSVPASLHFAGHIGIRSGGSSEAELHRALDAWLAEQRIGFAWGALAAGVDIVIAERLLAHGAELHVVLPCPVDAFEAQSVLPAGSEWATRFRAALAAAASVRVAGADSTSLHDPIATAHAGELAIGGALAGAARRASAACQLIVTDADGGGTNTARQAQMWPPGAGEQVRLTIPRDAAVDALFPPETPDPARHLAAHVAIGIADLADGTTCDPARIEALGRAIADALRAIPAAAIRAGAGRWEFALPDLRAALEAAARVQRSLGQVDGAKASIGIHLEIARLVADPASGTQLVYGPAPALARRLMHYAPPGVIFASDDLAVALAARGAMPLRSELYLPDERELGGSVHILLPAAQ
ncbi:MAG: hypothetical protein ACKOPE_05165 [Novosphingobium sp.]